MTLVKFRRGYETIEGKYYPYYIIEGKNYYVCHQGNQVVFTNEQDVIEYLEEE